MVRVLVVLVMLVNLGLGIGCVVDPGWMLAPIGVEAISPAGEVELRAMYGGLELGFAVFLGWCLMHPERVRIGLVAAVLEVGTMGLVRGVSWMLLQPEGAIVPLLIAVEFGGGCLGAVVLWRSRATDS